MRREPPRWEPTREQIEQIKRALREEAGPPAVRTGVGAVARLAARLRAVRGVPALRPAVPPASGPAALAPALLTPAALGPAALGPAAFGEVA